MDPNHSDIKGMHCITLCSFHKVFLGPKMLNLGIFLKTFTHEEAQTVEIKQDYSTLKLASEQVVKHL